jgi:hypothetical protein
VTKRTNKIQKGTSCRNLSTVFVFIWRYIVQELDFSETLVIKLERNLLEHRPCCFPGQVVITKKLSLF